MKSCACDSTLPFHTLSLSLSSSPGHEGLSALQAPPMFVGLWMGCESCVCSTLSPEVFVRFSRGCCRGMKSS